MNEAGKEVSFRADAVPLPNIATGDRKADEKTFLAWLADDRNAIIGAAAVIADFVRLSFVTLEHNQKNPAALEAAQRMHDADVAKLQALLSQ